MLAKKPTKGVRIKSAMVAIAEHVGISHGSEDMITVPEIVCLNLKAFNQSDNAKALGFQITVGNDLRELG